MQKSSAADHVAEPHSAVLYRSPAAHYPSAVFGRGMTLEDASGKSYLDMSGGAAVSCLGHGHPDVVAALRRQLEALQFAHTAFFTHDAQEQLAAALAGRFGDPGASVYIVSGGSEANETALKLAWQYWAAVGRPEKKIVISREHSYHGNTFGALSVSGNAGRRRASAAPLLDWPRVPPCYEYRERGSREALADYAKRASGYVERAIKAAGAEQVAAFICEPIVGSSLGVVAAVPGYLERVRRICDRHDVLLIADEIMCGSGRTGHYFAHSPEEMRPDIVTLAKGLGGGYQPLAAVIAGAAVTDVLTQRGFAHGYTYVGHPLACAAGVAVQQVIDRDDLLGRTRTMGERLLARLREGFGAHPYVGDIRGRGLFAGIEFVRDRDTREGFPHGRRLADRLRAVAMDHGLICYPNAIHVDGTTVPHVMLAPPMIVEDRHIDECIDKLSATIGEVFAAV